MCVNRINVDIQHYDRIAENGRAEDDWRTLLKIRKGVFRNIVLCRNAFFAGVSRMKVLKCHFSTDTLPDSDVHVTTIIIACLTVLDLVKKWYSTETFCSRSNPEKIRAANEMSNGDFHYLLSEHLLSAFASWCRLGTVNDEESPYPSRWWARRWATDDDDKYRSGVCKHSSSSPWLVILPVCALYCHRYLLCIHGLAGSRAGSLRNGGGEGEGGVEGLGAIHRWNPRPIPTIVGLSRFSSLPDTKNTLSTHPTTIFHFITRNHHKYRVWIWSPFIFCTKR